jgi:2,3-bisphosphoglycerate-independent phosphoglycerate mutase
VYDTISILKKLVKKSEKKIVLLVMDGLGGLPYKGKTALEAARTKNLDRLASKNDCGLLDPVFPGITPGSGPAHLALFGYDPVKYQIGRGILEALGVGVEVKKGDLTARGNFCIVEKDVVKDRRAGRIATEINKKIIKHLNKEISEIEGTKVSFTSGKEHRFVVRLRGEGICGEVTDTDPQKVGEKILESSATSDSKSAKKTADIINKLTEEIQNALKGFGEKPNATVLRGISGYPDLPQFQEIYKLKAKSIADYPMYRGLTQLIGMDVDRGPTSVEEEIAAFKKSYKNYDYLYVHIKKVDSYGEDGNFDAKVAKIEETDSYIPEIMKLSPDVLAVTGDHSTPATYKSHSWHPVPLLIVSKWARISGVSGFSESECYKGSMGRIPSLYLTSLLLAHAERLDKFGA